MLLLFLRRGGGDWSKHDDPHVEYLRKKLTVIMIRLIMVIMVMTLTLRRSEEEQEEGGGGIGFRVSSLLFRSPLPCT